MKINHFINGKFVSPDSNQWLENFDPAIGDVYSQVADGNKADVDQAIFAAEQSLRSWSHFSAEERSTYLLRIASGIESRIEDFARAESIDTGKPISVARSMDIPRAIKNFRFFGTAILHTESQFHETNEQTINYTLRRPRGVCGLISPWNLPLYLLSWKIAPALAMGNTVVAKPSELTPVTAMMLGEVCNEAGLPAGVLNIVQGLGEKVGQAITDDRRIPTISFTGGTVTGAKVCESSARSFKKVSLELGGKNPNIVFADANLDKAIEGSVRAAFANQGQVCLCGSRIYVERSRYEEFVDRFVAIAGNLKVGDPLEPTTQQGALVSQTQLRKVQSYVELGIEDGGQVECGGLDRPNVNGRCENGYFFSPTVLTNLDQDCRVNQEEIFGPVATITPFESESEVLRWANDTEYGLSASIWTTDTNRAYRVSDQLQAGTVWVNCWLVRDLRVPFGGVKQSGIGREGGNEALRFFSEPKNVCIQIEPLQPNDN